MAAASAGSDASITGINVTPLVDILLVVLIIFMTTAPLIHRRAIKVALPKAAHSSREAPQAINLVVDAAGNVLYHGRKIGPAALSSFLSAQAKSAPGQRVALSADEGARYGDVVRVLDAIRSAGLSRVGLEVSPL